MIRAIRASLRLMFRLRAARCIARRSGRRPGSGCSRPGAGPGACRGVRRAASRPRTNGSTSGSPAGCSATSVRATTASKLATDWCSLVSSQTSSFSARAFFRASWVPRRRLPPIRTTLLPASNRAASFTSAVGSGVAAAAARGVRRNASPGTDRSPGGPAGSRGASPSSRGAHRSRATGGPGHRGCWAAGPCRSGPPRPR